MGVIPILFVIMLFLIFIGVPIVYSVGISAIWIIINNDFVNLTILPSRMFKGIDSVTLASIPFFLLAAELLSKGSIIKRIINFSSSLIGHLKGGLAHVNILASIFFSGVQGTVTADSAAIGGLLIPAMKEDGYDDDLSVVVTATSSCIGPIIPPSVLMIIYAILTETSVADLFIGGAIPGVILGVALMGITHYWVMKRGYQPYRQKRASFKEIITSFIQSSPAMIVPLFIVLGLVFGVVTPTESGILACLSALIISGLIYRELTIVKIIDALKSTLYSTTVILLIISITTVFSEILVRQFFAQKLTGFILSITNNPTGILFLMAVIVFILGMAIDTNPLLVMLAAPLYKVGTFVGIDPIQLGVVLVMTALIGTISPPVSLLVCINCGIAKIPVSRTYRIIWSYLLVMMLIVFLVILFPSIITWLPSIS
ncbi:TRAP transporter large permease [Halocella sp. SP3-1]|uniref:TRAP transporter large permease n=1 Tax=Halocella sp. SP3-1 TaxID=2382161 RepID=UPI000F75F9F2|nr:TRAP transporter large permease [Halocella sp. SP3-1]AZO95903.1 TRAP transporter large permease [Halocella sp. SP3-1]